MKKLVIGILLVFAVVWMALPRPHIVVPIYRVLVQTEQHQPVPGVRVVETFADRSLGNGGEVDGTTDIQGLAVFPQQNEMRSPGQRTLGCVQRLLHDHAEMWCGMQHEIHAEGIAALLGEKRTEALDGARSLMLTVVPAPPRVTRTNPGARAPDAELLSPKTEFERGSSPPPASVRNSRPQLEYRP